MSVACRTISYSKTCPMPWFFTVADFAPNVDHSKFVGVAIQHCRMLCHLYNPVATSPNHRALMPALARIEARLQLMHDGKLKLKPSKSIQSKNKGEPEATCSSKRDEVVAKAGLTSPNQAHTTRYELCQIVILSKLATLSKEIAAAVTCNHCPFN
ncbi:hypothetical protein SELMODRAFT_417021 [Selaginella moellendorffii]|uniref:Uncharacterized protein n=1 Tax=Selaginella moellendorffii TaxID=88036 RepID=D8S144_SELML|nr:hypothetical protein SELMODRAFT_417021 [Selaginella moellendorffii]